jgi:hypothetical protein
VSDEPGNDRPAGAVGAEGLPRSVDVPLPALVNLAVELWRLKTSLVGPRDGVPRGGLPPAVRHALRRVEDFLVACQIEVSDLEGQAFDVGLPLKVVDVIEDDALPLGRTVIAETLSPLVSWRGQVIKPADVVTRRGTRG